MDVSIVSSPGTDYWTVSVVLELSAEDRLIARLMLPGIPIEIWQYLVSSLTCWASFTPGMSVNCEGSDAVLFPYNEDCGGRTIIMAPEDLGMEPMTILEAMRGTVRTHLAATNASCEDLITGLRQIDQFINSLIGVTNGE